MGIKEGSKIVIDSSIKKIKAALFTVSLFIQRTPHNQILLHTILCSYYPSYINQYYSVLTICLFLAIRFANRLLKQSLQKTITHNRSNIFSRRKKYEPKRQYRTLALPQTSSTVFECFPWHFSRLGLHQTL
jgi:hypothetical protein